MIDQKQLSPDGRWEWDGTKWSAHDQALVAREVPLAQVSAPKVGKTRNPLAVIVLSFITLGIYFLYWYGKLNAEIRAHEARIKVNVGWAVVAQFVPIANFVSLYNTAVRVQKLEIADGSPSTISPLVAFLLLIFFGIGYIVQVQGHLNAHWTRHQFEPAR